VHPQPTIWAGVFDFASAGEPLAALTEYNGKQRAMPRKNRRSL
jgi:hypothetical protein